MGAHDGDWEHVTVRLSANGSRVLGVYYSAHRLPAFATLIMKYVLPHMSCVAYCEHSQFSIKLLDMGPNDAWNPGPNLVYMGYQVY